MKYVLFITVALLNTLSTSIHGAVAPAKSKSTPEKIAQQINHCISTGDQAALRALLNQKDLPETFYKTYLHLIFTASMDTVVDKRTEILSKQGAIEVFKAELLKRAQEIKAKDEKITRLEAESKAKAEETESLQAENKAKDAEIARLQLQLQNYLVVRTEEGADAIPARPARKSSASSTPPATTPPLASSSLLEGDADAWEDLGSKEK